MRTNLRKYYKDADDETLSFAQYRTMLDEVLDKLVTEVVQSRTHLSMPGIGTLGIYSVKNKFDRPKINSAESLKLRSQIIKEGKIPFSPIKDENGKNIGDNGGEPWYVYYTNDLICHIRINGDNRSRIADDHYKFKAVRDIKKKLYNFIQTNPLKEAFYEVNHR